MKLLRNLSRRKLRTVLTIFGITIGIWALVVFGSMANKINALVDGGSQYFGDKIVVSDASGGTLRDRADGAHDGGGRGRDRRRGRCRPVGRASSGTTRVAAGFGVPDEIVGQVAGADKGHENFVLNYAQGRALTDGRRGQQRRGPRLRPRPQVRPQGRRHDRAPRRRLRGRRRPRADADGARHDRVRAAAGGPAALPRRPCRRSSREQLERRRISSARSSSTGRRGGHRGRSPRRSRRRCRTRAT